MKKLIYPLLFLPVMGFAQEKGIHFEHNLTWEQVKAKAKTEKKLIFMDCFTTWCGPCRYMSAKIFPQAEVGDYFNAHFISVKVQLDTTEADNAEVKSWYKSGSDLAKQYGVRVYPTYLFFDAAGNALHRSVGSSEADAFLEKGKDAADPSKQYYPMLAKYKKGEREPAFMLQLARSSRECYDMENMDAITTAYLDAQKDLVTPENIQFLYDFTEHTTDRGFDVMQKNEAAFDKIVGAGNTRQKVAEIIRYDAIYPVLMNENGVPSDWTVIAADVKSKYPDYAAQAISGAKVSYFQSIGDWDNFQHAAVDYMEEFGANSSAQELNGFAWSIFQNCSDIKCVEQALNWSKRAVEKDNNPAFIDTYANILYRLGKTDEAITWEQKAMDMVEGADKQGFQETIDRMKNGDKTWN